MVRTIARKETVVEDAAGRAVPRPRGRWWCALSAASFAAGWKQYVDIQRQHLEAQQATRAQWLNQPSEEPALRRALRRCTPSSPRAGSSLVDTGIDPYVGVAAWLEAHKQNEFRYRPAQDRTAIQRFGELTAAEGFLVHRAAVHRAGAHSRAFAGEREQGTLRQLLSLGVAAAISSREGRSASPWRSRSSSCRRRSSVSSALAFTSEFAGLAGRSPTGSAVGASPISIYFATVRRRLAWRLRLGSFVADGAHHPAGVLVREQPDRHARRLPISPPGCTRRHRPIEFQRALDKDLSDPQEMQLAARTPASAS